MSELRQDRTTGGWVIIAPQRRRRPTGMTAQPRWSASPPRFDPSCPFCPGHEAELPGIVAETAAKDSPGWSVRVVPNKYPALLATNATAPMCNQHRMLRAYGFHEVVIESPRHDADLADMTAAERQVVVSMYHRRFDVLLRKTGIEAVVLFRNHGTKSGGSLAHPHAQIIALGLVPPKMAALSEAGLRHYRQEGSCATCRELDIESQIRKRIVDENTRFMALVPYAAERPFELWIVPKAHLASFAASNDTELCDFSDLLGRSLKRLKLALDDPPYNFVIDSATKSEVAAPHIHWRLRIIPETVTWGGFEFGSGLPINPSIPEDDASVLREVPLEREARP
jgi:UDPglucose--hexose-1-phosphate uridylyltransferase